MIQFMRGTKSQLNNNSSIIAAGQPVFESDTGQLKIGNGSSRYSALEYVGSIFENTSSGGGEVTISGNSSNGYVDFPGGLRISFGHYEYDQGKYTGSSTGGIYTMVSSFAQLGYMLTSVKSTFLAGQYTAGVTDSNSPQKIWIGNDMQASGMFNNKGSFQLCWTGGSQCPAFAINYLILSR